MEKLKNWLEKGSLPGDHYELLGLAQFTDDTESVVAAVRKTTKFLHQYQNHKNASFVQHARKLQLLCATAGHTFADVEKWRFYDDGLMKRLSDEFCERKPPVDPRTWLCESQNIASHRLDEVTQFISAQTIVQPATTSTVNGVTTNTSNTSSQRELPFVIQNYEVFERLGEGGIGVVYKARHRRLDKLVAIKFLRNQYSTDASAAARFHREMKAIGKLDHQNIVRATDAGEFGDSKFLVMELINGLNLQEVVRRQGPLAVSVVCDIILQTTLGLQHAHEAGLVHRDIKPSNLMACHDGTIKILDLGLAISTPLTCPLGSGNESTTNLTAEGVIVGTIDYMSPEQRNGRQGVDARCDVYSLGCTMFFLLTGQAAFRDCGSDLIVRMAAHSIKPVAPLNQFRSDVPEDVEAIMRRMMAKAPDDRFQSAAELAKALTSIVNSYPKSDATSLRTPSSNLPPPVPFDHISPNVPPRRGDFPVPIPIPVPTKTMVPSNFFVNASSNRDIPGAPPARIGPQLPTPFKTVLPQREASASVSIAPVRDAKISKALSPAPNFPNIELPPVRQSLSETRQRPNMIMLYLTGTIVVATVIAAIVVLTLAYRRDAQTPNSHENTSKSLTYSNPCRIRNPWSLA